MKQEELRDGGQIVVDSNLNDQEFKKMLIKEFKSYPDVKGVNSTGSNFCVDFSKWSTEIVIGCDIKKKGSKRLLSFYYGIADTALYKIVNFCLFVFLYLIYIFFINYTFIGSFIFCIIFATIEIIIYFSKDKHLRTRCEQYIRDINNLILMQAQFIDTSKEVSDTKIKCPSCNSEISVGTKFCPSCGVKLPTELPKRFCSHCGSELKEGMNFCSICGNPIK